MIRKLFTNKILKNTGWLIGGQLANKILAFIISILSARYLGPENYGLINYAAAYTTFFASICTLGINSVIIKEFVDNPDEEGVIIGTAISMRAVSSFLSSVMIVGIVSIVDCGETNTIAVVALSSIGLIFQIFDTFNQWFQSKLQSKYTAIAMVAAYIIVSVYKVILLISGKSVRWFAVANAVEYIVIAVFLILGYRKKSGPKLSFSFTKAKKMLSVSKSFIISGLMVSIYASTDKLMLKQMMSETSVAHYSLAVSISVMWAFVLSAIIDSVYPSIMQLHSNNRDEYLKRNKQLYAIVFYASLFMSLLISACSKPIILLLYGEAYLPAVQPLRVVVWYTAFSYLGVAREAWVVCENKQKYLKYLYICAAITNVLLNLILIPRFGTTGAATASLITQMTTTLIFPLIMPKLRDNAKLMAEAILLKDILPSKKDTQA